MIFLQVSENYIKRNNTVHLDQNSAILVTAQRTGRSLIKCANGPGPCAYAGYVPFLGANKYEPVRETKCSAAENRLDR